MRIVQVFVIQFYQFNALILLERGKLFELLSKQIYSELNWRVFIVVVKVLYIFNISAVVILS